MQDKLISHLIAHIAQKKPQKIAVSDQGKRYTFEQLNHDVNQLANLLISKNYPYESAIMVAMLPSYQSIVSMLAIWKAGLTYLPVDVRKEKFNAKRVEYYIDQALPSCILINQAQASFKVNVPTFDISNTKLLAKYPSNNPDINLKSETRAYIIFTSGSSGNPKGVEVEHRGLVPCIQSSIDFLKLTEHDQLPWFCPHSFDAHIFDILVSLLSGACLHVVPIEYHDNAKLLSEFYAKHGMTLLTNTPSVLKRLAPYANQLKTATRIISMGEPINLSVVQQYSNKDCRVINGYGPSECTIAATMGNCSEDNMSCGLPIAGLRLFIVDPENNDWSNLKTVETGKRGELIIVGNGVARGYLNQPKLTQEKFIKNIVINGVKVERAYRTGDRCSIDSKGNLYHHDRIDRQVKLHGKLFNPAETEEQLKKVIGSHLSDCKVILRQANNYQMVVACIDVDETNWNSNNIHVWQQALINSSLSYYMVPTLWAKVTNFPLTANGKLDEKALLKNIESDLKIVHATESNQARDKIEEFLIETVQRLVGNADKIYINDELEYVLSSIQASVLISEIEKAFSGVVVTYKDLQHLKTIAGISCFIRQSFNPIIQLSNHNPLKSNQDMPNLFMIHSVTGDAKSDYEQLCNVISNKIDTPIIGLKAPSIDNSINTPSSLFELAYLYKLAIKKTQPNGPYLVAAWSSGGVIGRLVVNLLEADGDPAALFAIDALAPSHYQNLPDKDYYHYLGNVLTKLGFNTDTVPSFDKTQHLSREQQTSQIFEHITKSLQDPVRICQLQTIQMIVCNIQQIKKLPGISNMFLFQAEDSLINGDILFGWPDSDEINVTKISHCDHFSIMQNDAFVEQFCSNINRAQKLLPEYKVLPAIDFIDNNQTKARLFPENLAKKSIMEILEVARAVDKGMLDKLGRQWKDKSFAGLCAWRLIADELSAQRDVLNNELIKFLDEIETVTNEAITCVERDGPKASLKERFIAKLYRYNGQSKREHVDQETLEKISNSVKEIDQRGQLAYRISDSRFFLIINEDYRKRANAALLNTDFPSANIGVSHITINEGRHDKEKNKEIFERLAKNFGTTNQPIYRTPTEHRQGDNKKYVNNIVYLNKVMKFKVTNAYRLMPVDNPMLRRADCMQVESQDIEDLIAKYDPKQNILRCPYDDYVFHITFGELRRLSHPVLDKFEFVTEVLEDNQLNNRLRACFAKSWHHNGENLDHQTRRTENLREDFHGYMKAAKNKLLAEQYKIALDYAHKAENITKNCDLSFLDRASSQLLQAKSQYYLNLKESKNILSTLKNVLKKSLKNYTAESEQWQYCDLLAECFQWLSRVYYKMQKYEKSHVALDKAEKYYNQAFNTRFVLKNTAMPMAMDNLQAQEVLLFPMIKAVVRGDNNSTETVTIHEQDVAILAPSMYESLSRLQSDLINRVKSHVINQSSYAKHEANWLNERLVIMLTHRGNILRKQKQYSKSKDLQQRAIALCSQVKWKSYEEQQTMLAWIYSNLGNVSRDIGRPYDAINSHNSALQMLNTLSVPQLRATAQNLIAVADIHKQEGQTQKAIQGYNDALSKLNSVYAGKTNGLISYVLHQIGACYIDERKFNRALEFLRHSRDADIERCGNKHIYTLNSTMSIIQCLHESNQYAMCIKELDKLMSTFDEDSSLRKKDIYYDALELSAKIKSGSAANYLNEHPDRIQSAIKVDMKKIVSTRHEFLNSYFSNQPTANIFSFIEFDRSLRALADTYLRLKQPSKAIDSLLDYVEKWHKKLPSLSLRWLSIAKRVAKFADLRESQAQIYFYEYKIASYSRRYRYAYTKIQRALSLVKQGEHPDWEQYAKDAHSVLIKHEELFSGYQEGSVLTELEYCEEQFMVLQLRYFDDLVSKGYISDIANDMTSNTLTRIRNILDRSYKHFVQNTLLTPDKIGDDTKRSRIYFQPYNDKEKFITGLHKQNLLTKTVTCFPYKFDTKKHFSLEDFLTCLIQIGLIDNSYRLLKKASSQDYRALLGKFSLFADVADTFISKGKIGKIIESKSVIKKSFDQCLQNLKNAYLTPDFFEKRLVELGYIEKTDNSNTAYKITEQFWQKNKGSIPKINTLIKASDDEPTTVLLSLAQGDLISAIQAPFKRKFAFDKKPHNEVLDLITQEQPFSYYSQEQNQKKPEYWKLSWLDRLSIIQNESKHFRLSPQNVDSEQKESQAGAVARNTIINIEYVSYVHPWSMLQDLLTEGTLSYSQAERTSRDLSLVIEQNELLDSEKQTNTSDLINKIITAKTNKHSYHNLIEQLDKQIQVLLESKDPALTPHVKIVRNFILHKIEQSNSLNIIPDEHVDVCWLLRQSLDKTWLLAQKMYEVRSKVEPVNKLKLSADSIAEPISTDVWNKINLISNDQQTLERLCAQLFEPKRWNHLSINQLYQQYSLLKNITHKLVLDGRASDAITLYKQYLRELTPTTPWLASLLREQLNRTAYLASLKLTEQIGFEYNSPANAFDSDISTGIAHCKAMYIRAQQLAFKLSGDYQNKYLLESLHNTVVDCAIRLYHLFDHIYGRFIVRCFDNSKHPRDVTLEKIGLKNNAMEIKTRDKELRQIFENIAKATSKYHGIYQLITKFKRATIEASRDSYGYLETLSRNFKHNQLSTPKRVDIKQFMASNHHDINLFYQINPRDDEENLDEWVPILHHLFKCLVDAENFAACVFKHLTPEKIYAQTMSGDDLHAAFRQPQVQLPSKTIVSSHKVYIGEDQKIPGLKLLFEEVSVPANGDCGFLAIGVDRKSMSSFLLSLKNDQAIRKNLAPEIFTTFMSYCADPSHPESWPAPDKDQWQQWYLEYTTANDDAIRLKMLEYCEKQEIFEYYAKLYTAQRFNGTRLWLGITTALIYAEKNNISLYIWKKMDEYSENLKLGDDQCHICVNPSSSIHLLHTGAGTHFNILKVQKTLTIKASNQKNTHSSRTSNHENSNSFFKGSSIALVTSNTFQAALSSTTKENRK